MTREHRNELEEYAHQRFDPDGDIPWASKCHLCPATAVAIQGGRNGMEAHRATIHPEMPR